MVQSAERYAHGSIDYGLKWACTLTRLMESGASKAKAIS